MPEYFDISIIARKTTKDIITKCFKHFHLIEGENEIKHFGSKKILLSYFENEEADFYEITFGFPDQVFYRDLFEQQLKPFTSFIQEWFDYNEEILFALCSYELNGYLIGDIKSLYEFNEKVFKKFPIVYKRKADSREVSVMINLEAQDILYK